MNIMCVVSNSQQGIELGFSTSKNLMRIESTVLRNNRVGLRYGDNYDFEQVVKVNGMSTRCYFLEKEWGRFVDTRVGI